jgi:hypothetical protein
MFFQQKGLHFSQGLNLDNRSNVYDDQSWQRPERISFLTNKYKSNISLGRVWLYIWL